MTAAAMLDEIAVVERQRDIARRIACALFDETVAAEAVVEAAREVARVTAFRQRLCRGCGGTLTGEHGSPARCDCYLGTIHDALAAYDALHSDEVTG